MGNCEDCKYSKEVIENALKDIKEAHNIILTDDYTTSFLKVAKKLELLTMELEEELEIIKK